MKKWCLCLAFIVMATTRGWAVPTIHGATGLIMVPTAESLQYKQFNMGIDYVYGDIPKNDGLYYKANLGTFKSWELGIVGGKVPTEGVFVNVKYYLMSDNERFPLAIAIGSENLFSKDSTDVYMVASKKFQGGIGVHLGFKALFQKDELVPSIMGGAEYVLSNQWSVLADFNGERKKYMVNAGVRYFAWDDLSVNLSVLDIGHTVYTAPLYSIGVSYTKFL